MSSTICHPECFYTFRETDQRDCLVHMLKRLVEENEPFSVEYAPDIIKLHPVKTSGAMLIELEDFPDIFTRIGDEGIEQTE